MSLTLSDAPPTASFALPDALSTSPSRFSESSPVTSPPAFLRRPFASSPAPSPMRGLLSWGTPSSYPSELNGEREPRGEAARASADACPQRRRRALVRPRGALRGVDRRLDLGEAVGDVGVLRAAAALDVGDALADRVLGVGDDLGEVGDDVDLRAPQRHHEAGRPAPALGRVLGDLAVELGVLDLGLD